MKSWRDVSKSWLVGKPNASPLVAVLHVLIRSWMLFPLCLSSQFPEEERKRLTDQEDILTRKRDASTWSNGTHSL